MPNVCKKELPFGTISFSPLIFFYVMSICFQFYFICFAIRLELYIDCFTLKLF